MNSEWKINDTKPEDGTDILFYEGPNNLYKARVIVRGVMYTSFSEGLQEEVPQVLVSNRTSTRWDEVKYWTETPEEFKK
jgi:hypothetical protein